MWIVGAVLVLVAIGLFAGSSVQKRKLGLMQATQTASAAELQSLAQSVAKEIGAGSFAEVTELKGTIRADHPLVSELAQLECVYYSMRVSREYEETYWDTDPKGNRVRKTRRGSEVVSQNTRQVPFEVQDASGGMRVEPEGATFVAEKALSRFDPGEPGSGSLSSGRWSLALGTLPLLGSGRRTLGYRYEEEILPVGRSVYVLGEASDAGGTLAVRKPSKKGMRFMVSLKSEEELVRGAAGLSRALAIAAGVLGAAGIVLAALDLAGVL